jgi:hypothetical protein
MYPGMASPCVGEEGFATTAQLRRVRPTQVRAGQFRPV